MEIICTSLHQSHLLSVIVYNSAASIIVSNAHSWLYGNLSMDLLIFVYFILVHCIAQQYMLRKRDDIVHVHLFAEEFLEKEVRGEEILDKERSLWERRNNIVLNAGNSFLLFECSDSNFSVRMKH